MTKGTHLLRSALLALLALAVISGGSLAAGDLFDDDYKDCPYKTRLRDGQIDDLSVNRDSSDEDHVNVSWTATDPATWGLGPNAYRTSLVVLLDDGSTKDETLSLGSRKVTFEDVKTGREVQVQMAIVVDTADGKYLISDILETTINQSLTEPAFMTPWMRVTSAAVGVDTPDDATDDEPEEREEVAHGSMYYVGYNENFGNYIATANLATMPSTPRLRIGLKHSLEEDADQRDKVDFNAYVVRITDEDGDVVSEGDDVKTVAQDSRYKNMRLVAGTVVDTTVLSGDDAVATNAFYNVRINDGGKISVAMQTAADAAGSNSPVVPPTDYGPDGAGYVQLAVEAGTAATTVYAMPPDEHRDFPIDTLTSDETYTFTAWAINDDSEVISPVASLKVRPIDTSQGDVDIVDYLNATGETDSETGVTTTEFTVLK